MKITMLSIIKKSAACPRLFVAVLLALSLQNSYAGYYKFSKYVQGIDSNYWDSTKVYSAPDGGFISNAELCPIMLATQTAWTARMQSIYNRPVICHPNNSTTLSSIGNPVFLDSINSNYGRQARYDFVSTSNLCNVSGEVWNNETQACEVPLPPIDIPKNQGASCQKCINPTTGNPIHIGTGNKFQTETDYVSSTQGGLRYRRYYNSFGEDTGLGIRYGNGWSADYWQRIVPVTATEMEIRRPDGKYLRFRPVNGVWTPDADVVLRLEELIDAQSQRTGWLLTLADDAVEEYDSDIVNVGRPIAITTRNGLTTTLEYGLTSAEGGDDVATSLDRVTDAYGRTLTFHYDVNLHLETVNDPAGNDISYTRDANDNLTSVAYPDETPGNTSDNPTRIYHYEDTNYPNALTGITDETGNRFATWSYDTEGRANSSEHAGGSERVDIVYNADGTATVTESNGGTRTYTFETLLGVVKPTQVTGDQCSNCGSDVASVTYDANGYPTSETDYNGNVTNFIYNSRGLQTSRTEAVGTPEERTITTEWHPTFRLPIKISEPGKITIFTYDAQGRLLEREEKSN